MQKIFDYLDRLHDLGITDLSGAREYLLGENIVEDDVEMDDIIIKWKTQKGDK